MKVPFLDLAAQYGCLKDELLPDLVSMMEKGQFIGGQALSDFEASFAAYVGTSHAAGVGNGTDALQLALRAAGIGPGDEVITAANTFVATVEAIILCGAKPVLVDMDPHTYHLNLEKTADAIGPKTRAIMPVHLYGDPVDLDPFLALARDKGLLLIEDAAQAHGAKYKGRSCGSMGDLAGFSFYPGKNLGAWGDGGAVVCNDADLDAGVRRIRDHGSAKKYHHEELGTNSRLDSLQARVLSEKLKHLDNWNENRRRVASAYEARLSSLEGLQLPFTRDEHLPVFHLYVIRSPRVKEIDAALSEAGVGFGYHYPVPVHLQPAFLELADGEGSFPEAEKGAREILSLPIFAELQEDQIDFVAETVKSAL